VPGIATRRVTSVAVTRRSILLVEDDPDSRIMMTAALEFEGYRVIPASNGVEGLRLAQEHKPELILLDLMMPVMAGEEFRQRQLKDRDIRKIPVVIVSAQYDAPIAAKRLKAMGCIGKPVDFDALTTLVRSALPVT
jgi:two-component system alkaline phosphatase synthesis response regulator PhoP